MTPTESFYGTELFAVEVDFSPVSPDEVLPPLRREPVPFAGLLRVAALTFAGVITLISSGLAWSITEPQSPSADVVCADVAAAKRAASMTAVMKSRARLASTLFATRPHRAQDDVDPDYGF